MCRLGLKSSTNLEKSGEAKLQGGHGTMGIENLHVDDEGCLGGAFVFDENLSIWLARVDGN